MELDEQPIILLYRENEHCRKFNVKLNKNHPALRVSTRGLEQRVNKKSPQSRFAVSEKTAIERRL